MNNQLFPILTLDTNSSKTKKGLFPSAGLADQDASTTKDKPVPDWLENKSFTSETAQNVVKFQEELKKLQQQSSESDSDDAVKPETPGLIHHSSGPLQTGKSQLGLKVESDEDFRLDRQGKGHKKRRKRERESSPGDSRDGRSRHKHKKKHKKHRHRDSSPERTTKIPGLFQDATHIFLDDISEVAPDHPFRLDRKPDQYSWSYGSLYTGNVAHYRHACHCCLGTSPTGGSVYVKDMSKEKKKAVDRYYMKENRKRMREQPVEVITNNESERKSLSALNDYVPVREDNCENDNQAGGLMHAGDVRDKILDKSTSLYVQGVGANTATSTEDVDVDLGRNRVKVGEFNRKLRENPNDVHLWMNFVKFQDTLVDGNIGIASNSTDTEKDLSEKRITERGLLDKKLSILEKSLEKNPGNIDLLLAKVNLNATLLDSSSVNKELENILFVHSANCKLWKFYLMFNQSRLAVFSVSKVTKLYHKCFKTLKAILSGQVKTHSVPDNLEEEMIGIFLQYVTFLQQSGYKERALATCQAMLEFNLFCPTSVQTAVLAEKMAAFEEFWDSSRQKLGTCGGKGWMNHYNQGNTQEAESASEDSLDDVEEAIIEKQMEKSLTWYQIETLRDSHHWLPWQPDVSRGQTEDDCEDPERLVVFDDVRPAVFTITQTFHYDLALAVLELLGFTSKSLPTSRFANLLDCCQDKAKQACNKTNAAVCGSVCDKDDKTVRKFAIELLKQVSVCFSSGENSDLTLRIIEIELEKYGALDELQKGEKKEVRKFLKNILKEESNRNDLKIWCTYIKVERQIGKSGEAKATAETALTMYGGKTIDLSIGSADTLGYLSLHCLYCELLLNMDPNAPQGLSPNSFKVSSNCKKSVMMVFGAMLEGSKVCKKNLESSLPSGNSVLKWSSCFTKHIDTMLLTLNSQESHFGTLNSQGSQCRTLADQFLQLVWCAALFAYCRSDLDNAITLYKRMIDKTATMKQKELNYMHVCLHQCKLKLIVYHMSVSCSPLVVLREHLDMALQANPDNADFLALFTSIERKARVSGRLNRQFDVWCRKVESPWPAVIGLLELCSHIMETSSTDKSVSPSGLVHRARSWLEHSLGLPALQHNPLLWRLYLQLESMSEQGRRLKGVFYRAIQQCPWSKALYMDGVRLLGADQFQEILDLLTENEIRLQTPVEELDILIQP